MQETTTYVVRKTRYLQYRLKTLRPSYPLASS